MTPESLLDLYDEIVEAPDAIPQLRRLVLDLAVRGLLVEQDSAEGLASEILAVASAEMERSTSKRARDALARAGKAASDGPYPLPENWLWARLDCIADFSAGRTPPRENMSFWNTGDHPWVSISDMEHGKSVEKTKETVSRYAGETIFGKAPVPRGTMIMSFKLTIGKIARLGMDAYHNEAIIAIRPFVDSLDPYLFLVLPDLARGGKTTSAIKGATLNRDSISSIMVPLPPIGEQIRIVAKINELMEILDRLEAERASLVDQQFKLAAVSIERLVSLDPTSISYQECIDFVLDGLEDMASSPEQIGILRQATIHLAVRGKLVPGDPEEKQVDELLGSMKDERDMFKSSTSNDATIVCQPYDIPSHWRWVRLEETILEHVGGGTPSKEVPENWDGHIMWASVKDIGASAKYVHETRDRITEAGLRSSTSNLIEPGHLIVVTRMGLGKLAINTEPMAINQDLRALRLASDANIDFHYLVLKAHSFEGSGLTVKGIKVRDLLDMPFPCPPAGEQVRIVNMVDKIMAVLDALEQALVELDHGRSRLSAGCAAA